MLVYLYNTHLFYATQYKLVHWRIEKAAAFAAAQGSLMYTNTPQGEGEGGSGKGEQQTAG